jgi:hypothetical protein
LDFDSLFYDDFSLCDKNTLSTTLPFAKEHTSAFVDIDGDCINDILILSEERELTSIKKTQQKEEEKLPKIQVTNTTINNSTLNNNTSKANSTTTNIPTNSTTINISTNSTTNSSINPVPIRRLEIWRGIPQNNTIKYCLTSSSIYKLDKNLGLFSLADVDRNGLLDIVFPVLESPPKIKIAYNKIPFEYEWTEDYCATHIKNTNNLIPLLFDDFNSKPNINSLQIFSLSNSTDDVFYEDDFIKPIIRFGDFDMDSFQDIIVTFYNKDILSRSVKIFYNHEMEFGNSKMGLREFKQELSYNKPLLNNAIYASFFDLDENGKLDVIITYKEDKDIYNTIGFFNTYIYDRYYLKSLFLKQRRINFSNKIGASFRYICADLDGERRMDLATQGIQLNQLMMNLPYAFIGVGRSNNYIENFCVINGNRVEVR